MGFLADAHLLENRETIGIREFRMPATASQTNNPSCPFEYPPLFYGRDLVVLIFGTFIASTQVRTSICLRKCEKCGN